MIQNCVMKQGILDGKFDMKGIKDAIEEGKLILDGLTPQNITSVLEQLLKSFTTAIIKDDLIKKKILREPYRKITFARNY